MELEQFNRVEAWVDVGGTFTDCLVRINGQRPLRGKTLSSGRVPISLRRISQTELHCPELASDGDGFWIGASLAGYTASGECIFKNEILKSTHGGRLAVADPEPIDWTRSDRFEIIPSCEAPVLAVRRLLQVPLRSPLPPLTVRLGTTRGTNALLTRSGPKTALLVTDPFVDLLAIGDQSRPDLFSLEIVKPRPLAEVILPVHERLSADGEIIQPLDLDHAQEQLQNARRMGCDSLAISLLHGYRNPQHEQMLESLAQQNGFRQISLSSRVAPTIEYLARTQTTAVDAYLGPVIGQYLTQICDQLGGPDQVHLSVMTSAGGLVDWRAFSGKDCILSGPAGGVIALQGLRRAFDRAPMIGLDMGGTSTDVCRIDQQPELSYESNKAGVRILTPTLPIETVAAGGGSVCWFDGVSLRVGPQSAGALPGPACYGRGGPLTITDLNVFSGRIPSGQFPFPLDFQATENRIAEIQQQIAPHLGSWNAMQVIDAFRALASQQMADAVRSVSIKQGIDPRDHVLVGFGGAAGQHICEIAEELDVDMILDHPDAGILSAVGLGLARSRVDGSLAVYLPLEDVRWEDWFPLVTARLNELTEDLRGQIPSDIPCTESVLLELRYLAADATLTIPLACQSVGSNSGEASIPEGNSPWNPSALAEQFSWLHERRFGYRRETGKIELAVIRLSVEANQADSLPEMRSTSQTDISIDETLLTDRLSKDGAANNYRCVRRDRLTAGDRFVGPLLVLNAGSTLTVEENWKAEVLSDGSLMLSRLRAESGSDADSSCGDRSVEGEAASGSSLDFDPVFRDCYAQRLSAIATQMGYVLQQTAISVNIKQRRDFSCAVFDADGNLLASAPHVPVHLGAMGQTIRSVIEKFPDLHPRDCFLCNDPYEGGSHLPDLTVMMPVFEPSDKRPSLWVASRAHHADVGGISPGSMSIHATKLEEEGIVIPPFRWIQHGQILDQELTDLVGRSKYPPRNWSENLADLRAQAAACLRGEELLGEYADRVGWKNIRVYGTHLMDAAEQRIRQFVGSEMFRSISAQGDSPLEFQDALEDGTAIQVRIEAAQDGSLLVDFGGTGAVSSKNFNANNSIVTAAVLYVLRCLVRDELPLNAGVLRAVTIKVPESVLSPPTSSHRGESPAVAAGNVETSQRVVDVLLGAFGVAAASQGTMNNVLFGTEAFGFYETLAGGTGATGLSSGASAVHSHMTNTRLTDPEVLEFRYPVRLIDFRIRSGSGGSGQHTGGEGMIRSYQFLKPVTLSLISSRRGTRPFGLKGGRPGAPGENWLELPDGQRSLLPANCQIELPANSKLTILTPGGGGYG